MKKIIFCILFLSLVISACSNDKDEETITSFMLVEQALEKNDWSVAAHLSQRILIDEIDVNKRWQALQSLVLATKRLGDIEWTITALESNSLDFSTPIAQKYVNTELMNAHASTFNYSTAREYAEKLLDNPSLSDEEVANIEITIANYSINLSDFITAESYLKSCLEMPELTKSFSQCTLLLGNVYYLSNNLTESMVQINNFLALSDTPYPDRAHALFLKGDMLELQGNKKEALAHYKQSIQYHPNPNTVQVRIDNLER